VLFNYDNICVVNESSHIKNLDGGVSVIFDSLTSITSFEDVTHIVNSL